MSKKHQSYAACHDCKTSQFVYAYKVGRSWMVECHRCEDSAMTLSDTKEQAAEVWSRRQAAKEAATP